MTRKWKVQINDEGLYRSFIGPMVCLKHCRFPVNNRTFYKVEFLNGLCCRWYQMLIWQQCTIWLIWLLCNEYLCRACCSMNMLNRSLTSSCRRFKLWFSWRFARSEVGSLKTLAGNIRESNCQSKATIMVPGGMLELEKNILENDEISTYLLTFDFNLDL